MPAPMYPADFRARTPKPQYRRRNSRTVSIPDRAGPHVKLVFAEMARLRFTYDEVEEKSGVRRATMKAWRKKNTPSLESIQSVLSVLGWDYVPVAALETLPPELAGEVVVLARKFDTSVPELWAAVVAIGVEQRLLNMETAERAAVLSSREDRRFGYRRDNESSAPLQ